MELRGRSEGVSFEQVNRQEGVSQKGGSSNDSGGRGVNRSLKRLAKEGRKRTAIYVTVKGSEVLTKLAEALGTYKSKTLEGLSFLLEDDNLSTLLAYEIIKNLLKDKEVSLKLTVYVDGKPLNQELLKLISGENGGAESCDRESYVRESGRGKGGVESATKLSEVEPSTSVSQTASTVSSTVDENEEVGGMEQLEQLKKAEETIKQIESELRKGKFLGFSDKLIE